jgi:hypothetical protein
MSQVTSSQQSLNWGNKKREDILNLALGSVIALFSVWGLYIGISLHL